MSGLELPHSMGVETLTWGAQQHHALYTQMNTAAAIEQELTSWGFEATPRPVQTYPSITTEGLTSSNTDLIIELLARVTAWHNYSENTATRVKIVLAQLKRIQANVEREIRAAAVAAAKRDKQKKPSEATLKVLPETNPHWQQLDLEILQYEQRKALLDSAVNRATRDYTMVSRSVELRKIDIEAGRRTGNAPYAGAGMRPHQ